MPAERLNAGLYTKGDVPIPLIGVAVEATLEDFCSRVVVSQRFRNDEKNPIEAVYVFPIDSTAAVCGFEALVDGARIVGRVEEREKAFEQYDDAIAAGHGAFLVDQERRDIFTASLGNILPGQEVVARIMYVAEMDLEGDQLRFVLPTTVSPRYAPASDRAGVGRTPAEALNPPVAWSVPYGLTFEAHLAMSSPIRSIESPSHPIACDIAEERATVRLGARETALDRDFVLNVGLQQAGTPRAWVEVDPQGQRVAVVSLQPQFESAQAPCEVVFVVDRSGSMAGSSIAEARNALQLCLRSLPAGSYFNIVGFGDNFEKLFPKSRAYDEGSLSAAKDHVAALDANLGGTEILPALEAVLALAPVAGLTRQILLLTDGEVTNTEQVIALVREHASATRVFAFGIGHGASHALVRGIARAGGGAAEFITPGERLEAKVVRQLGRALAPGLTNLRVDWGGLRVRQAPHAVPPVFAGGRVLIYGFIEGTGDGAASDVCLHAASEKGPVSFGARIDPERARAGSLAATLAAQATIRDLEDGVSAFHERKGSRQDRGRAGKASAEELARAVKAEIVRLGVAYSLCSRETSFVAVEERQSPALGEIQLRRVPIALTHGWGEGHLIRGAGQDLLLAQCFQDVAHPASGLVRDKLSGIGVRAMYAAPSAPSNVSRRLLDDVVALQHADGSWDLTDELLSIIGVRLDACSAALDGVPGESAGARRALATALAVTWLERQQSTSSTEWSLLVIKADDWVTSCGVRAPGGATWYEVAEALLI